jgi:serine/threonine protein phosphatase PrpC
MLSLEWRVAAATDTGCKRSENQDNYWVSPDNRVFVVADGMGGERGGATASLLTVKAVEKLWNEEKPDGSQAELIEQWLIQAVSSANSSVWATSAADPAVHGMGTTIVVAVQSDDAHLYIAHVGDSRAYMIREGKAIVLTQDHSVVMELLLQGKISQEQYRTSPFRNYITRCIGHNNKVEIDKTPVEVQANDRIILCTDGLPTVLQDEDIGAIGQRYDVADEICKQLVDETLLGGAPDNVTVVVICYTQVPSERLEEQLAR